MSASIKAISLWEPWASLIRTRAKTFETRSWDLPFRGKLLICAAKRHVKNELDYFLSLSAFQGGLAPLVGMPLDLTPMDQGDMGVSYGVTAKHLNFGMAVALVEVLRVYPTDSLAPESIGSDYPFGDYSSGRFAWKLNMLRNDFEPFPVHGRQGIFNVDEAYIESWLVREDK